MPRYMLAPLNDAETHPSLEAARDAAEALLEKMGREVGGFIVFEVKEIGRCEYARPIWTEVARSRSEQVEDVLKGPNSIIGRSNDEIPF